MPDLPSLSGAHALFLDFDGTLAPIVDRPDLAVLPDRLRPALETLFKALQGAIAVVSGREIGQLERLLAPFSPALAGGHGVAIRESDRRLIKTESAPPASLPHIADTIEAFARLREGLLVERKARGVALHFRARPDLERACRDEAERALRDAPDWRLIAGKMVFEIAPKDETKGHAMEILLDHSPFRGRIPVAIGDDATDEDMFRVANARGGFAIKVGAGASLAQYRVADPAELLTWLVGEARRLQGHAQGDATEGDRI
jgi:trehalose 6-phosphate phosphatase